MLIRPYDAPVEHRYSLEFSWPPMLSLLVILAVSALLPDRYRLLPTWLVVVLFLAAVLLEGVTFVAANTGRKRAARFTTESIIALITLLVVALLAKLLDLLATGGTEVRGWGLISSGVHVWVSNVLVFGLWYWVLDRGGPYARLTHKEQRAELFFPEMAGPDFAPPGWSPGIMEYMYVAFTNATAFSPTDTLPLSARVRALMTAEAAISLATIALIAARGVNILS